MKDQNTVIILGGSNSVISHGFSAGIESFVNAKNLSLGASGSLQNICFLNRELNLNESRICAIVTESNVNDSHIVITYGYDYIIQAKSAIYTLYETLYSLDIPVIAVLLPLGYPAIDTNEAKVFAEITDFHRSCISHFAITCIDVDYAFQSMDRDSRKAMMCDSRHPNIAFMFSLGSNIGSYLSMRTASSTSVANLTSFKPSTFFIDVGLEPDRSVLQKRNSRYSELTVEIPYNPGLPLINSRKDLDLLALLLWPNHMCQILLSSQEHRTIRSSNTLLSFHELKNPLPLIEQIFLSSLLTKLPETEPSINVSLKEIEGPSALVGYFVGHLSKPSLKTEVVDSNSNQDSPLFIPLISPFIKNHKFRIQKGLNSLEMSDVKVTQFEKIIKTLLRHEEFLTARELAEILYKLAPGRKTRMLLESTNDC
jgi:hypothetical protein